MARIKEGQAILQAAQEWKNRCLLNGGSIFSDKTLWARKWFDELGKCVAQPPDPDEGNFYQKLRTQLTKAPTEVCQLAAELLWYMSLIQSRTSMSPQSKREHVREIWECSGEDEELPSKNEFLAEDVLGGGVIRMGQNYNQRRPDFDFLVALMQCWFALPQSRRAELLKRENAWLAGEWIDKQPNSKKRHSRHILLYLLFPDSYESVAILDHKKAIVAHFTAADESDAAELEGVALDKAVLEVRKRLTQENGKPEFNFYDGHPYNAWRKNEKKSASSPKAAPREEPPAPVATPPATSATPYNVRSIINDGCFLSAERIETLVARLRDKKNLILQGPPGTGKTWLAKRLAYALMGAKDSARIWPVQFHPNLSYEDFVQGWRPAEGGKLGIVDGIFLRAAEKARNAPEHDHAVIIEEINRGNPAMVFGELLTLLEADKRDESEAIHLTHSQSGKPFHVPGNLCVIGTMNTADRSIAMIDFALRRRFAFETLEPQIGAAWRDWVCEEWGLDRAIADEIAKRVNDLNRKITRDATLGKGFCIGHSYLVPSQRLAGAKDAIIWFRQVVTSEIAPLLEEYWFDSLDKAEEAEKDLLADWD